MADINKGLNVCERKDWSIANLINAKKLGRKLNEDEIKFFIESVVEDRIAREQVGAMLMAMWLNQLDEDETTQLTHYMIHTGEVLQWPDEWKNLLCDKHSTGGVGDKISLVLAPALAACGLKVPMISGRSLGHTGGTLDKLEAIPGFNVSQSSKDIKRILTEVGCCIVGQTKSIVPADRVLYAARDLTSTVDSLPLIASSIVSKKIAENVSALILDVKYGKAAFMADKEKARELGEAMVRVSNRLNIKTTAVLTSMDCPVGYAIGNALEVLESLECLHGEGPEDLEDLVLIEGAHLLRNLGKASSLNEGKDKLREVIHNGSALKKFRQMIIGQGTSEEDATTLCTRGQEFKVMKPAQHTTKVVAQKSGYVTGIHPMNMALVSSELGGGRKRHGDVINHAVGIILSCKIGQKVQKGDLLATVHHDVSPLSESVLDQVASAIDIDPQQPAPFCRFIEDDVIE